jgi:hypothetical protein
MGRASEYIIQTFKVEEIAFPILASDVRGGMCSLCHIGWIGLSSMGILLLCSDTCAFVSANFIPLDETNEEYTGQSRCSSS